MAKPNVSGFLSTIPLLDDFELPQFDYWLTCCRNFAEIATALEVNPALQVTMLKLRMGVKVIDTIATFTGDALANIKTFLEALEAKVKPNRAIEQHKLYSEIHSFQQSSLSYSEYISKFDSLMAKAKIMGIEIPEPEWCFILKNGISNDTHRNVVCSRGLMDLDATRLAIQGLVPTSSRVQEDIFLGEPKHKPSQANKSKPKPKAPCPRCGKKGHWASDCWTNPSSNMSQRSKAKCFRCGKPGHLKKNCHTPASALPLIVEGTNHLGDINAFPAALMEHNTTTRDIVAIDSGCTRPLTPIRFLPTGTKIHETAPLTYTTANGTLTVNRKATFQMDAKATDGKYHNFNVTTMVLDDNKRPMLLPMNLFEKANYDRQGDSYVELKGLRFPLNRVGNLLALDTHF